MHIISNVTSSKVFIIITLIFNCYFMNKTNAEDILIKKYGYGSLYWKQEKHTEPGVYNILDSNEYIPENTSIREIAPSYSISQHENIQIKNELNVSASLSVTSKKKDIVATVSFFNRSNNSLYLYKKNIPLTNKKLCDRRFLITSENINIDYLGGWCNYGSIFHTQDWLKVPAKKEYKYNIILNRSYDFLPGQNTYNIGSVEQIVVDDKWLTREHINNLMFSVLNWRYDHSLNKTTRYTKVGMDNYLYGLIFSGQTPAFYIRTNEITIKIDGNKIKSFYDITK